MVTAHAQGEICNLGVVSYDQWYIVGAGTNSLKRGVGRVTLSRTGGNHEIQVDADGRRRVRAWCFGGPRHTRPDEAARLFHRRKQHYRYGQIPVGVPAAGAEVN